MQITVRFTDGRVNTIPSVQNCTREEGKHETFLFLKLIDGSEVWIPLRNLSYYTNGYVMGGD